MERLTVPDVIDRFIAYRRQNPVWGSLHVVLEEGNVADADVRYCIKYAESQGDSEGKELGEILLSMTRTQRCRIDAIATHQVWQIEGRA